LSSTLECYKKCELELEAKRVQLKIYEKIRDIKEDLNGMSDTEKLQKIKRTIEEVLSHPPIKYESDAKNDESSEFINGTDSDANSPLTH
uniref:SWIRM-assoc_1 domain-containing protein n=1 Tax=Angiostrongylus cantonensis TaxID=6313 RepID=A0A0K0D373_ANGCA